MAAIANESIQMMNRLILIVVKSLRYLNYSLDNLLTIIDRRLTAVTRCQGALELTEISGAESENTIYPPPIPKPKYELSDELSPKEYEREVNSILLEYLGHRLTDRKRFNAYIQHLLGVDAAALYNRGLIFYAGPTLVGITRSERSLDYVGKKIYNLLRNRALSANEISRELEVKEKILIDKRGVNRVLYSCLSHFYKDDQSKWLATPGVNWN